MQRQESYNRIIHKIVELKPRLKEDGIEILGIFGSYARGDYTEQSDVDILYQLDNPKKFAQEHNGWGAFTKLLETKEYISKQLNKKVDLVDRNGLNRVGKEFILKDLKYV